MKKSQVLAVAGATLLVSGVLAACSNTSSNNAKLAKDYRDFDSYEVKKSS